MKKIDLVGNQKIFFNDGDVAKILSNFFSNVINLLGISQNYCEVFREEIRDPTLKAVSKYSCYPRILKIREKYLSNKYSTFSQVSY